VLQHSTLQPAGLIEEALLVNGHTLKCIHIEAGDTVAQAVDDCAGLVVLGGPMAVYEPDRFPHIGAEIALIRAYLTARLPILAICFGSQLLAAALDTEVHPGPAKEFGWYDIHLSPEAAHDPLWQGIATPFKAFMWHGDSYDVPEGAVHLASSDRVPCHAYRMGTNVYGILFHPEVTPMILHEMVSDWGADLAAQGFDAGAIVHDSVQYLALQEAIGRTIFRHWVDLLP